MHCERAGAQSTGGLGSAAVSCLLPQLTSSPECFRHLQTLDLGGAAPDTRGVRSLAQFLANANCCDVRVLRLDKCGLSDGACALILGALACNSCVRVVSVSANRCHARGIGALAKALAWARTPTSRRASPDLSARVGFSLSETREREYFERRLEREFPVSRPHLDAMSRVS